MLILNYIRRFFIISNLCLLLNGCANQVQTVPLSHDFWTHRDQKVTVVVVEPPKPSLFATGPQGLVDVGINYEVNKPIQAYLNSVSTSWFTAFQSDFSQKLSKYGVKGYVFPGFIPSNQKDYTTLFAETNTDKLLIIKLDAVGATRQYYGFIPLGAPQAYCVLSGQLISDQNNQVLWSYQATATIPVDGEWAQPPSYPNLSNAINTAINKAQQKLINNFFIEYD